MKGRKGSMVRREPGVTDRGGSQGQRAEQEVRISVTEGLKSGYYTSSPTASGGMLKADEDYQG